MFTKTAPIKPIKKNSHHPAFLGKEPGSSPFIPEVQAKSNGRVQANSHSFISAVQPVATSKTDNLSIGKPNETYEIEADTVADTVVSKLNTAEIGHSVKKTVAKNQNKNYTRVSNTGKAVVLQAKCSECAVEEKLQKKEEEQTENDSEKNSRYRSIQPTELPKGISQVQAKAEGVPVASHTLHNQLNATKGKGSPLSQHTKITMGTAFGADFNSVRIHTDTPAVQMSQELHAKAFTHGNDIYFNSGKYDPHSTNGKWLLAHELTHTLQQTRGTLLQRVCNTTAVGTRDAPVFFPNETNIIRVFEARATLRKWGGRNEAVGLVQQALVDLGYDLGNYGPNGDGVDRKFGPVTEAAVTSFQQTEGITTANNGTVDSITLKCLDETRSKLTVQAHQSGTVSEDQYQVGGEVTEGEENSIYFARGSSVLDADDKARLTTLLQRETNPIRGCNITLKGFISEDELAQFGAALATDRIQAVDSELAVQQHHTSGDDCTVPPVPVRSHLPLPDQSSGVSDYKHRRKVEILLDSQIPSTVSCTSTSPEERSLNLFESIDLTLNIARVSNWIDNAINQLTPGNAEGDAALATYFGTSANRATILSNLTTWRDHIRNVIPVRSQAGTECNDTCRIALAFNNGRGTDAMMTLCPSFFEVGSGATVHEGLNENENKSFIIMHEAGHGSIGTVDTAYGHRRLIEFVDEYPSLAENNTDSYTLMILCLNGFDSFCTAPVTQDSYEGLANASEEESSRRGLAWLQTWIEWSSQDLIGVYGNINEARETGDSLIDVHGHYAETFDLIVNIFGIRRPEHDPAPTFGEQTMVAAIFDRFEIMNDVLRPGLQIEKDTSNSPFSRWSPGPGRTLFLDNSYFGITNDRTRVETLLPLLLRAMTTIALSMEVKYDTLTKEIVALHWGNHP